MTASRSGLIRGGLRFVTMPGSHRSLVLDPVSVRMLGQALHALLHGKGG